MSILTIPEALIIAFFITTASIALVRAVSGSPTP